MLENQNPIQNTNSKVGVFDRAVDSDLSDFSIQTNPMSMRLTSPIQSKFNWIGLVRLISYINFRINLILTIKSDAIKIEILNIKERP